MLDYQLGEMKNDDGLSLRYVVDAKVLDYVLQTSKKVTSTHIYKQLLKRLPSKRVLMYFQFFLRDEFFPLVRQAYVIRWYRHNKRLVPPRESVVNAYDKYIFPLIKDCWDFEDVPLRLTNIKYYDLFYNDSSRQFVKKILRKHITKIRKKFNGLRKNYKYSGRYTPEGTIACHYAEGFDYSKRNDINWYPYSGVNPEKVLIYFDTYHSATGKPIGRKIIQQIEEKGFEWIALKRGIIRCRRADFWDAPKFPENLSMRRNIAQSPIEKWVVDISNNLIKQVYYWRCFYDTFNVRINYIPGEGVIKNIVQAIAFDIEKEKPGALVGKQRSEAYSHHFLEIGFHPKHIFFVWNKRVPFLNRLNYDLIETFIISGYPNNIFKKSNLNLSKTLKSKGARFVVALFDNAYSKRSLSSKGEIAKIYQKFFRWIIKDSTFGLIIKSKKPYVFDELPSSVHSLLKQAIETGRCIRLKDEWGRFPIDASSHADIAIGCNISTAVIETVIKGGKGVLYDMTGIKTHEFYKWGYERIIFDDFEKLLVALKRYKENPDNEQGLGDWSSHIDELDPFRDGRGGQRMGIYMQWLLEGFDNGKNQNESIQYANEKYAKQWGEDKINDLRDKTQRKPLVSVTQIKL